MILLDRLIGAFYWVKVKSSLTESNYLDALNYLNKVEDKISSKIKYKFYFFKAFSLLMLKEFEYSVILIEKGITLAKEVKEYNDDEKKYLEVYGLDLLELNFKMLDKSIENKQIKKQISLIYFDIKKVRRNITYNFPMRNHKEWNDSYE